MSNNNKCNDNKSPLVEKQEPLPLLSCPVQHFLDVSVPICVLKFEFENSYTLIDMPLLLMVICFATSSELE